MYFLVCIIRNCIMKVCFNFQNRDLFSFVSYTHWYILYWNVLFGARKNDFDKYRHVTRMYFPAFQNRDLFSFVLYLKLIVTFWPQMYFLVQERKILMSIDSSLECTFQLEMVSGNYNFNSSNFYLVHWNYYACMNILVD